MLEYLWCVSLWSRHWGHNRKENRKTIKSQNQIHGDHFTKSITQQTERQRNVCVDTGQKLGDGRESQTKTVHRERRYTRSNLLQPSGASEMGKQERCYKALRLFELRKTKQNCSTIPTSLTDYLNDSKNSKLKFLFNCMTQQSYCHLPPCCM